MALDNIVVFESQNRFAPMVTTVKNRNYTYSNVETILASSVNVEATWTDVGSIVDMQDYNYVNLFISLTINDSTDVRFRGVVQIEEEPTTDYSFCIESISADKISVSPEYVELSKDENSNLVLEFKADGVRYIQIQAEAGVVGATPATIDKLYTLRSMK